MSLHSGTRITNVSKNTPIYVTFGTIDSATPSAPNLEPLPPGSPDKPAVLALTPLLPEKTLVYDPQSRVSAGTTTTTKHCVMKMYVWSVPQSQPIVDARLLWQGYVVTCVAKPIVVDPDEKTVTYNGTAVPNLEVSSLIERFQHYQEGSCMNSAGGLWAWILGGILLLIIILACVMSPGY